MPFWSLVGLVAAIIISIVFVLFPEARKLAFAWTKLFIKDRAATPEGARALFEEAIDEAEDNYHTIYKEAAIIAGKMEAVKKALEKSKTDLTKYTADAKRAKADNRITDAEMSAKMCVQCQREVTDYTKNIEELELAYRDALEVVEEAGQQVKEAKVEKEIYLRKMESNASLEDIYEGLNKLKSRKPLGKLITHVKDKVDKDDERIAGLKANYKNSTDYQQKQVDKRNKHSEAQDFLNNLK